MIDNGKLESIDPRKAEVVELPREEVEALRLGLVLGHADLLAAVRFRLADGGVPDEEISESSVGLLIKRGRLPEAGQWTHAHANIGRTGCSQDTLVRLPLGMLWWGGPGPARIVSRHWRAPSPVFSNGILYVQGQHDIFAVDAYNGSPLWQQPIPGFRRIAALRDSGNMAATADLLYVAAHTECRVLDAQTGKLRVACPAPPSPDGSPQHWGYLAVVDNLLFGSTTREGASWSDHSRAAIGNAYYDGRPIVTSTSVFAGDRTSGERKWLYRAGLAYDQTPVPDDNLRTPRVPDEDRIWLTLGANWRYSKQLSVDIGYAHLFVNDPEIKNGPDAHDPTLPFPAGLTGFHSLNAEYDAAVDMLSLQVNWQFD